MSDTKKAQEEVSTIMFLLGAGSALVAGLGTFLLGKIQAVAVWALGHGFLEKSDRVLLALHNGIGLDLGRIFIIIGVLLLIATGTFYLAKIMWVSSKQSQNNKNNLK